MNCAPGSGKQEKLLAEISQFVAKTSGLRISVIDERSVRIHQSADDKSLIVEASALDEVLLRSDSNGTEFIQVNFSAGHKILLTDCLIGFKPSTPRGVDLARLPRVVTTPDVINVFEAIQDALHATGPDSHEISVLKKIFDAVLNGGEAVGFDLSRERSWLARVPVSGIRASS